MSQPRIDLLEQLCTLLESLPQDRFDYCYWVGNDWKGHTDFSCGTTACALGWATTLFKELYLIRAAGQSGCVADVGLFVNGEILYNFEAAAKFFNITDAQAMILFCPNTWFSKEDWSYSSDWNIDISTLPTSPDVKASPSEVAAHIREFIEFVKQEQLVA